MIGIDLVNIERIEALQSRFGEKALRRFLNDDEIALVKTAATAAGFWAAKEACVKALGCGIGHECGFHDIIIRKSAKGAPLLSLSAPVRAAFQITDTSLSITHDGGFAIAVVALERG